MKSKSLLIFGSIPLLLCGCNKQLASKDVVTITNNILKKQTLENIPTVFTSVTKSSQVSDTQSSTSEIELSYDLNNRYLKSKNTSVSGTYQSSYTTYYLVDKDNQFWELHEDSSSKTKRKRSDVQDTRYFLEKEVYEHHNDKVYFSSMLLPLALEDMVEYYKSIGVEFTSKNDISLKALDNFKGKEITITMDWEWENAILKTFVSNSLIVVQQDILKTSINVNNTNNECTIDKINLEDYKES